MMLTLQPEPFAKVEFGKFRGGFYLVQRAILFHDVEPRDESATFNDTYVSYTSRSMACLVRMFRIEYRKSIAFRKELLSINIPGFVGHVG